MGKTWRRSGSRPRGGDLWGVRRMREPEGVRWKAQVWITLEKQYLHMYTMLNATKHNTSTVSVKAISAGGVLYGAAAGDDDISYSGEGIVAS